MAQYRVKELSFINNQLAQPEDIVEYEGEASENLEPVEDSELIDSDATRRAKPGPRRAKPEA